MFTRFHDDDIRVAKQLQILGQVANYQLDVPGNGMDLAYFEDPYIRLQKHGSNLRNNTVNVESDLFGMTRKYNRDDIDSNNYIRHQVHSTPYNEKNAKREKTFVCETRAVIPAWNLRGIEIPRWESPFLNPQSKIEKEFKDNISTRILEKETYLSSMNKI